MILREGVSAAEAAEMLRTVMYDLQSSSTNPLFNWYIEATQKAERQLASRFEAASVAEFVHTVRYWNIVSTPELPLAGTWLDAQPAKQSWLNHSINAEQKLLADKAEKLWQEFEQLSKWLEGGELALLDTNTLMHSQTVDKIPWNSELATKETVRLIVPLAVIEELDRKKFEGGDNMRKRAQRAIGSLYALRRDAHPDNAAPIHGTREVSATLEIPRHDVGRVRMSSTDEELVAYGEFLKRASGGSRKVTIVTRDMNLQIRAQRAGLEVLWLPEKYGKDQGTATPQTAIM